MKKPIKHLKVTENIKDKSILDYATLEVDVQPNLQNGLFIIPSDRQQVFNPKDYSVDGFGSFTVDKIPEEYVKPVGRLKTKTYTPSKQEQRILAGQYLDGDQIISAISDDYVEKKFGLTKAGREVFNSAEVKGPSTEDSPKGFHFVPDFTPKIIVFNLTANVTPTSSTIGPSSSHTSLVSSFWVDKSVGDSDALQQKAGTFLYAQNKVNVSRNNIGYEYSEKINEIFVVLADNTRIAPISTTNGAYEIQYWG